MNASSSRRILWMALLTLSPAQASLLSFTFSATSPAQIAPGGYVDFAVQWTYARAGYVEQMFPGDPEPAGGPFLGWQYWHAGVIEYAFPESVSATFTVTTTPGGSFTQGIADFSGTRTWTLRLNFPDAGTYTVDLAAVITSSVFYESISYDAQRFCTFGICGSWDKRATSTYGTREISITPSTAAIPVEVGIPEPSLAVPLFVALAALWGLGSRRN